MAALLASCGADPNVPVSPSISPTPIGTTRATQIETVAVDFDGYVVEAGHRPEEIGTDQLRIEHGSLVQSTLTSEPSLECGIAAQLTALTVADLVKVGGPDGDVFQAVRPTKATLVHAVCRGGSALLIIDESTSSVAAFEIDRTLPQAS